jgi:hypothetical protein
MKKNYDFSKAVKNPFAKRLKRQLTPQLDEDGSVQLLGSECEGVKKPDEKAYRLITLKDEEDAPS